MYPSRHMIHTHGVSRCIKLFGFIIELRPKQVNYTPVTYLLRDGGTIGNIAAAITGARIVAPTSCDDKALSYCTDWKGYEFVNSAVYATFPAK